jgi:hypothetical protein
MMTTTNTFDTGTLTVAEASAGQPAYEYNSLAWVGTAATELTTIRQRGHSLGMIPKGVYAVSIQARKTPTTTGTLYLELVDGTNTVLEDDAGTANQISIDISTMSSSAFTPHTGFFRLPSVLPSVWYVQLRSTDIANTYGFYLDDFIIVAAQPLYKDGPYAALIANGRDLAAGDRYTVAVANSWAGKIQTWFYRWFGVLLPSAVHDSETIPNP